MPYLRKTDQLDQLIDSNGTPIQIGDVLENNGTGPYSRLGPQYFVCYTWGEESQYVEIRDLDHNNVGMCNLGLSGDVVTLGNYKNHLDKLTDEDLEYYFGITREGKITSKFRVPFYDWTWKDTIRLKFTNLKRWIADKVFRWKYKPVIIPLIRKPMPQMVAFDIVGVQRLEEPTGITFKKKI